MTKENIAKFFDAVVTDKTLAAELAALATENGYDFTAEELLELGEAWPLSDDDAEKAVAAGVTITSNPFGPGKLKGSDFRGGK